MILTFSRGKGWLVPLLLVASFVCMIPSGDIGVHTCHVIILSWLLLGGAWVGWYGTRSLRLAAQHLERPLKAHEWVFDFGLSKKLPFHSFMFIQMKWWTFAFALACYKMVTSASW